MFGLNRLPRLHHPLFYSELLERASDDGFLISIEAGDAQFDEERTREFLASIGGKNIELVRGE
jgi:hypothetical protein